jgi:capsular exopolysaccharide synthesis family protein
LRGCCWVQQGSEVLSLGQVVGVLWRRLPVVVLCVVVVGGVAFGFSRREPRKYTATASVSFSESSLSQQIAGLPAVSPSTGALQAQQSGDVELVRLGDMAARTAVLLGHGLTEAKVAGSLSIGGHGESSVVEVSATAGSPVLAAAIANTYVRQFVAEQRSANRRYFVSALALVHRQLGALSPKQRVGPDGLELQDRVQTLGLLEELDYGNVQVAQEALVPSAPSSPKTSKNTLLGLFLGLLIGLGLAFALERVDPRVRGPEELAGIYRLPLLGAVPKSAALSRPGRARVGRLPAREAEAFGLIRAHLRFLRAGRELRTVMVASAAQGEGKSTIAAHLAETAARLGSRVLLVEGDLRDPTLARELGLQSGRGLADVLVGALALSEATQQLALGVGAGMPGSERALDVLLAGAVLPANPAELLESPAMSALLQQARSAYELVVIDTPPLTAVPDAFPLLGKVDGVVIVGWIARSRRDTATELHQILAGSDAPLIGVIANASNTTGHPTNYTPPNTTPPTPTITTTNGTPNTPHTDKPVPTAKV